MRLGNTIRRDIAAGHGRESLSEYARQVSLSEEEILRPWQHRDSIASKLTNAREIDIVDLFEEMYGSVRSSCVNEQGWEETRKVMEAAQAKAAVGLPLSESEVMSNAFQLLTQAKLFTTMQAVYELTPATYEGLFGVFDSPYGIYDHHIPSDAPELSYVKEGETYPEAPISDRYCKTKANKFGRRVSLSRETMITDRTGRVVEQAEGLARSAKYREDELAALAFRDAANSTLIPDVNEQDAGAYYPEGTNVALYRTSAGSTKVDYEISVNKVTGNNLLQWDNLSAALIKLRAMTNVRGQYIDVLNGKPLKIVVPFGLEQRATLLSAPGAMAQIDKNASAGTESAFVRVPDYIKNLLQGQPVIQVVVWSKLPTTATASQSTWYLCGDTTQQFRKHQRWPVEFSRANQAQLGGEDFKRDVILSVRGGFNAGFRAVDDKFVIQNTNS